MPNFESQVKNYQFNDAEEIVIGFEFDKPGMVMMIDIKVYTPETSQFSDFGWTICPIIEEMETDGDADTHEFYVVSGTFSLPIYQGRPSNDMVDRLLLSEEPLAVVSEAKNTREINLLGTTTCIAKLVDQQRKTHFRKSIDEVPPSNRYLDIAMQSSHTYKKDVGGGLFSSPKLVKSIVPKKWANDHAGFTKQLKKQFKEFIGLAQFDREKLAPS